MKRVIISLIFITSVSVFASNKQKTKIYNQAKAHHVKQDYFTALDKLASIYKYETPDQNIQHFLEELTTHTGTHYFNTFSDLELRKLNIPTTDLIMAKRNLYLKKFHYTHKRLKRMPKGHRLYPEALLVKGTAYMMNKQYQKAIKTYQECTDVAYGWENRTENKQKNYFAVLKETCIINIARLHYKQKDYKLAIRHYEEIPKKSFKWPYTLIEKAWAYYYIGNYNRSLGILLTYNSPLLESYFMPEAEVLKAMNYFKLCLYEDALELVDKYYNTYAPRSKKLKSIIKSKGRKPLYYFDLMFSPIAESEKSNKFIRNLVTQVSKRVKYNLDLNSFYAMNTEIYRANKGANLKLLMNMQKDLKEQINHYVKVSMYSFINEMHQLSTEMFNLKLEILSRKRDLAYKNKTFKKDRSRGDFDNIKREPHQEFWTFKSAFWADELGDYSLALSSTCKTRRLKPDGI
jgi:tetratricopeptide (TPR) repeat protein